MSILTSQDWNELSQKYQKATPFPSICIDNFLTPEFLELVMDAYPEYNEAIEIGHEFSSLNENKKVQITIPNKFPEPLQKLTELLASKRFIENMETLSGIKNLIWDPSFTGGGMHLTNSSGLLDVHLDFNFEKKLNLFRRINILIYLNKEWHFEWGGNVELWDKNVASCEGSFEPIANRCVIFSTSDISFHGVTAVTCPEGVSRNSFAAYYYSEDAGDNTGEIYGGNHSTLFRARPKEYTKKYLWMPLNNLKNNFNSLKNTIRSILKG